MASKKTPPFSAYPAWTTAKFFGFIRSGLREKFNRWPPKYEVLAKARKLIELTDDNGEPLKYKTGRRQGESRCIYNYQCNGCKQWFKQTEVQVDHITPAGSLRTFADLPSFVSKLFVGVEGLQVMCYTCHQTKTNEEKKNV